MVALCFSVPFYILCTTTTLMALTTQDNERWMRNEKDLKGLTVVEDDDDNGGEICDPSKSNSCESPTAKCMWSPQDMLYKCSQPSRENKRKRRKKVVNPIVKPDHKKDEYKNVQKRERMMKAFESPNYDHKHQFATQTKEEKRPIAGPFTENIIQYSHAIPHSADWHQAHGNSYLSDSENSQLSDSENSRPAESKNSQPSDSENSHGSAADAENLQQFDSQSSHLHLYNSENVPQSELENTQQPNSGSDQQPDSNNFQQQNSANLQQPNFENSHQLNPENSNQRNLENFNLAKSRQFNPAAHIQNQDQRQARQSNSIDDKSEGTYIVPKYTGRLTWDGKTDFSELCVLKSEMAEALQQKKTLESKKEWIRENQDQICDFKRFFHCTLEKPDSELDVRDDDELDELPTDPVCRCFESAMPVVNRRCYIPADLGAKSACGNHVTAPYPVQPWRKAPALKPRCVPNSDCRESQYWFGKRCTCRYNVRWNPHKHTCDKGTKTAFSLVLLFLSYAVVSWQSL